MPKKNGRKHFFFEKKKQKTFDYSASVLQETPKPNSQSFLVLFFKKEPLSAASLGQALDTPAYLGSSKKSSRKLW
jgi:hypothetical protein